MIHPVTNIKREITMVVRKKAKKAGAKKSGDAMKALKAKIASMKKEFKAALKKAVAKAHKEGMAAAKKAAGKKPAKKRRKAKAKAKK